MDVHSGFLTIRAPSLLKTKLYSNHWCILYTGRSKFSPRIDLYEEQPQAGHTPCKKTIYIEEAKWVKIDSLDNAFSFEVKHNKQYIFVTASEPEVILWILNLCCLSRELFDTKYIIGIEDLVKMDSYQIESAEEYVVKENILYSSSNELYTYMVSACRTGACIQHGLQGLYKLRVGHTALQLLQHDSEKEIASWSLMTLKTFGHSSRTFFLECGTRSTTGAGKFTFQTAQGEEITERVNSEAKRLHNKNHESDNSSVTVFKGSAGSDTDNIEKAKRPVPPQKPNSMSLRNSLPENTELQGMHYVNGQQLSRKGIPAFGIPVFGPQTGQVPNERDDNDDLAPVEGEDTNRENLSDVVFHSASIENNTKPLLKWSSSYQPSESGSKKDGKKAQKEWKREQKKREEEEKKERKRQEEEQRKREEEEKKERKRQEEEKKKEQKRREEDEKRIKKEQKKKHKETKRSSTNSHSVSVSDSVVSCGSPEAENPSSYAEVDLAGSSVFTEKIYSEPWGTLPCIPVSPGGDGDEVVYAQPEKRPVHQTAAIEPREITHIEYYETVETTEPEYSAPHVILPKREQTGEICDTDTYSHLNAGTSAVMQENLYGMASASSPITAFDDENPYEDTGATTYESVD